MAEGQAPGHEAKPGRDVFISYASQDAAVANKLVETLERHDLRCWIAPRDVKAGAQYADAIIRALTNARVMVLVLSGNSVASTHVAKEIERASSKKRTIIALRTDSAPLTPALEYFLSDSQWIEVKRGQEKAAYAKLIDAIRDPGPSAPSGAGTVPARAPPPRSRRIQILLATGLALVAVTLAVFFAPKFLPSRHSATAHPSTDASTAAVPASDKSIAVLPFVDMSEKHDQEYMSDGIAEELLNLLAQAPGLKVIARTSSFSFKGKGVDIAEIARRLNVANVLEGSVRKSGDKIRITAQLIHTADSTHLWSETYDRPLKDVFAVQDEIAGAIVQALQIRLAGGELNRRNGGTQNLEAYQLYLRARDATNQDTRSSLDAANDYLEKATTLDPDYGLAWSQLAWVFTLKTVNNWLSPAEGYGRARQLAEHALKLSSDLAQAHASLMFVYRSLDWDWAAAEVEGRQALAIDPTNPDALDVAGNLSFTLGRWNEAEQQLRLALVRDPLNAIVFFDLGNTYYLAGRFAEAEGMYRKVIELAPQSGWIYGWLGKALLAQGKAEEALAMAQHEADRRDRLGYLPIFLQAVGRQDEADAALREQIAEWAQTCAVCIARTYAYRGDRDRALEWLERAYRQRDASLTQITGEPLLRNLHGDPRFKAFLRKLNLPE